MDLYRGSHRGDSIQYIMKQITFSKTAKSLSGALPCNVSQYKQWHWSPVKNSRRMEETQQGRQNSIVYVYSFLIIWPNSEGNVQAYLILLPFTDIVLFFFYKLKVCGNHLLSKSIGAIFLTAFVRFVSLCHILVILEIFQTFSLLYLLWCSMIIDLWCYYCKTIMTC